MSNEDIIRAWKDEEYRNSLSEEQRNQLPENPAGMVELSDQEMETFMGGKKKNPQPKPDDIVINSCCARTATVQKKKLADLASTSVLAS
jgi:mersacidin/lichenicidin family type 2 lantibiotic